MASNNKGSAQHVEGGVGHDHCLLTLFYGLSFMLLSQGSETVLNWLYLFLGYFRRLHSCTPRIGFIVWGTIGITYLCFKRGLEAQGIGREQIQLYAAYWVIFWSAIVLVFNGWEVFTKGYWNPSNLVIAYINIPIFAILVGAYCIVKKPKWIKAENLDFVMNIPTDEEVRFEEPPPKNIFVKFLNVLFT